MSARKLRSTLRFGFGDARRDAFAQGESTYTPARSTVERIPSAGSVAATRVQTDLTSGLNDVENRPAPGSEYNSEFMMSVCASFGAAPVLPIAKFLAGI
jgi:hypothetical protein